MKYFVALVQNEWMKVNRKRQIVYFCSFIAVVTLIAAVVIRLKVQGQPSWLEFAYGMVNAFSLIIPFFTIAVSAQMITDEYRDGTMKQLLIRPASRTMVFASKLTTAALVLMFVYVFAIMCTTLVGMILFGLMPDPNHLTLGGLLKDIMLQTPRVLFYALLAMLVAVLTRSPHLSLGIPVVMMLVIVGAVEHLFALPSKPWYKYVIFPNLDWAPYFDSVEKQMPFVGASFGFSITIFIVYMVALWTLSVFIFNKRDV